MDQQFIDGVDGEERRVGSDDMVRKASASLRLELSTSFSYAPSLWRRDWTENSSWASNRCYIVIRDTTRFARLGTVSIFDLQLGAISDTPLPKDQSESWHHTPCRSSTADCLAPCNLSLQNCSSLCRAYSLYCCWKCSRNRTFAFAFEYIHVVCSGARCIRVEGRVAVAICVLVFYLKRVEVWMGGEGG